MSLMNKPSMQKVDALQELGNIGAENAVSGISKLLNRKIDISVTYVDLIKIQEIQDLFEGPESMVSVTCVEGVSEKVMGNMFLIFSQPEANKLIELITGKSIKSDRIADDYDLSVLKEVGNIMCACYFNALSRMMNKKIIHSVPVITQEKLGSMISKILEENEENSEYAVLLETEFELKNGGTKGTMFYISTPSFLAEIFSEFGVE